VKRRRLVENDADADDNTDADADVDAEPPNTETNHLTSFLLHGARASTRVERMEREVRMDKWEVQQHRHREREKR